MACYKSKKLPEAGCGMILYCSNECRYEHWEKVHKNHCKFLANPSECPQSEHDAKRCHDCLPAAGTGKSKQKVAVKDKKITQSSSSYECIAKDVHFAPSIASPHPFPVAGDGNDLLEKNIIITHKLVHKLSQNPQVAKVCGAEMDEMLQCLWSRRMAIWARRKIFSHRVFFGDSEDLVQILDLFETVRAKVIQGKAGKDAEEIWKIVQVVHDLLPGSIFLHNNLDLLKNPTESMPEPFQDLLKQVIDNKIQVLSIAEEILDSLSTQVVSFEDIVKKLCGGKKKRNCSFCGVKTVVNDYFKRGCPSVSFDALFIKKFCCGREDCERQVQSNVDEMMQLSVAVNTACVQREAACCDFCFKLCPIDEAHRCCNCLTVVYCSKDCHKKDKEEYNENYCFEDERKTKADHFMRRQPGEMIKGQAAAMTAEAALDEQSMSIINQTLEAFRFEESKKD